MPFDRKVRSEFKLNVNKVYKTVSSLFPKFVEKGSLKLDRLTKKQLATLRDEVKLRNRILVDKNINWTYVSEAYKFHQKTGFEAGYDSVWQDMEAQLKELMLYLTLERDIKEAIKAKNNIREWEAIKEKYPNDYITQLKELVQVVEIVSFDPRAKIITVEQGCDDYLEAQICYGIESDTWAQAINTEEQILKGDAAGDYIKHLRSRSYSKRTTGKALVI